MRRRPASGSGRDVTLRLRPGTLRASSVISPPSPEQPKRLLRWAAPSTGARVPGRGGSSAGRRHRSRFFPRSRSDDVQTVVPTSNPVWSAGAMGSVRDARYSAHLRGKVATWLQSAAARVSSRESSLGPGASPRASSPSRGVVHSQGALPLPIGTLSRASSASPRAGISARANSGCRVARSSATSSAAKRCHARHYFSSSMIAPAGTFRPFTRSLASLS